MNLRLPKVASIAVISLLFCISFPTTFQSLAAYKDVASNFWGVNYINTLSDKGIIKGYADGTFQPNKEVNRAEFLKLLVAATNLKLGDGKSIPFPDTDKNAWYAPYVETAVVSNIARGYDDGKFRPEASVNRAEALKMLLRLKLDMDAYSFDSTGSLQVKDADEKSWYGPYINAAMKYHIIDQLLTSSRESLPGQALTRAEAAYLIYQLQFANTEFALLPVKITQRSGQLPSSLSAVSRPIADAYTLFTLGGASLIQGPAVEEKVVVELASGNISTAAFSIKKTVSFEDLKQKMDPSLLTIFQKYQVRSLTSIQNSGFGSGTMFEIHAAAGTDTSAFVFELLNLPSVLNASVNTNQTPLVLTNDPYIHSKGTWWSYNGYDDQWGLKKINAPAAWENTTGSPELIVAIIDTGIEKNHPELKNRIWHNTKDIPNNGIDDDQNGFIDDVDGWNFIDNNNNIQDENGHGTHIAGIIGAESDNAVGIAGVNTKSKLMILKVFDEEGAGNSLTTAKAIKYAADSGAKIINLSLAGESTKSASGKMSYDEQMLLYAYQKGVSIISAAGNQAIDITDVSPANYPYTMAVAATEPYDTPAEIFSNFGKKIDISAPGADILSTFAPDGYLGKLGNMQSQVFLSTPYTPTLEGKKYAVLQGTSMAAGYVTGTVSLLLSKYPSLQPETVRSILRLSAQDIDTPGFDIQTGTGRLDARKALEIAPGILEQSGFVSLVSPEKESTLSGVQDITAAFATERTVSSWRLFLTAGGMTSVLAEGKAVSPTLKLTSFDTKKVLDGPVKLSLEASLTDGAILKSEASYTIENIALRENDTAMTSSGVTMLSGTSALPISKIDVTWSTGSEEKNDGISTVISTQGFVIHFDASNKVKIGDTVTFHLNFTTTSGLLMKKEIKRKVSGTNSAFTFSDGSKSCSVNFSCKNVPENGYIIEYGIQKEKIMVFANHSEVYLLNAKGEKLPGWPKKITNYISQAPLFVSIKNTQGQKVPAFVLLDEQGKIHAWDINGNTISPLDGKEVNKGGGYLSALDRDNDGNAEFFLISKNIGGNIGMFDSQGVFLTGWPYTSTYNGLRSAAIGDTNGDGSQEIFFGDDLGIIYGFSLQGKSISGWPRQVRGKVMELQMSDLNKDGKLEILVLTQYQGEDKSPKIGLYLLNAAGTVYAQGDQEFSGLVPAGGALRILDERMLAIAINGFSPLQIQSKIMFLETSGKFIAQVSNTTGHTSFGPMLGLMDSKKSLSVLVRNEDQALMISSGSTSATVLGSLPKAKDIENRDIPLCIDAPEGCTPAVIFQSSSGVGTKIFTGLTNIKSIQPYAGYNIYRNNNAHANIALPVVLNKVVKASGQGTAAVVLNRTVNEQRIFTVQYSDLPDFKESPKIRFISRTAVSDPYEISLLRKDIKSFEFTLPLYFSEGIYEVQIGDNVAGYYSLPDLFSVDIQRIDNLTVKDVSPMLLTQNKKTILTVHGTGFSPYHEYALHVGDDIFRDGIEIISPNEMHIPVTFSAAGMMNATLEDLSQGAFLKIPGTIEVKSITAPENIHFSRSVLPAGVSGFITVTGENIPENSKIYLKKEKILIALEIFQTRRNLNADITALTVKSPVISALGEYIVEIRTAERSFEIGTIRIADPATLPSISRTGKLPAARNISTVNYIYSGGTLSGNYQLEISSDSFSALFSTTISGNNISSSILLPDNGTYIVHLVDMNGVEIASDPLPMVINTGSLLQRNVVISRFAPSFASQGDTVAVKILGKGMNTIRKVKIGTLSSSSIKIINADELEAYFVIPRDFKEGLYTIDVENTEGKHTTLLNAFEIKKRLNFVQPVITKVTPTVLTAAANTLMISGTNFPKSMKASLGSSIQSSLCGVSVAEARCIFDLKNAEKGRYPLRFQDMDTGVVYETGSAVEVKDY